MMGVKKPFTIHNHWLPLYPTRGMQFRFWFEVAKRVNYARIKSNNYDKISTICKEVDNDFKSRKI